MTSIEDGCRLDWTEYSSNLTINFKDLLERKELVDVSLVADGHLFNAHRLVLSALSPYFRKMFTQMPVDQQAFVFLKDVSKETLEGLITFIYSGQVNVKQEHLDDFIKIAKALDIKGLVDGGYSNSSDVQAPVFNSSTPSYNSVQYQSTRTTPVPNQTKPNLYQPSIFQTPMNTSYQHQDNFEYDHSNEVNVSDNEYGDFFGSDDGGGVSTVMDQQSMQDNGWNNDQKSDTKLKPEKTKVLSPERRLKRTIEYNFFADIRDTGFGSECLFYNNNKFNKHNNPNKYGQQRWECCKRKQKKCKAAISTMKVNGYRMMKIINNEHLH